MPRPAAPDHVGLWQPEPMVDVPDDLELTAPQARVLGCLIEKQATTPESYPLTLKALTTACNQTSSRFPVVDYDTQLRSVKDSGREYSRIIAARALERDEAAVGS